MMQNLKLLSGKELNDIVQGAVLTAPELYNSENPKDDKIYLPLANLHHRFETFRTFYQKNKLKKAILRGELGMVDADGRCHVSIAEVKEWLNMGR